jgi:hypothetical protein
MDEMIRASSDGMPVGYFGGGVVVLFMALFETGTGKALGYREYLDRAKNPYKFWLAVAVHYLVGAGLLGHFLYMVYGVSD